ncbi:MAG: hypothetical protein L0I29_02910 [Hyphomicrobiales bacterium]|nr:hypothetical protein [Hyphomicrobiales bacterium]
MTPDLPVSDDLEAGRLLTPFGFVKIQLAAWVYVSVRQRDDPDVTASIGCLAVRASD